METSLRILLIEDNPDDRVLIKRGLKKGFENPHIEEILNQKHLDKAVSTGEFDIVITDYQLGWTDGIKILITIKAKWPECPVIMMTVMDTEEIAINAMEAGLDDYVVKSPSQFARLADIVRSALEQKEQEQALQEAEIRYKELYDSVPVGLYRTKLDGQLVSVNQAMVDILGYPDRQTLIETNAKSVYVNPDDRSANMVEAADKGFLRRREHDLYKYDGEIIAVEMSFQVIQNEAGEIILLDGYLEDITERKRVEEALSHIEMLNKTIIESVQEGVLLIDHELRYVVWNEFMERLSGLKAKDVIGKGFLEFDSEFIGKELEPLIQKVFKGESVHTSDISYPIPKTEKTGWIEAWYDPLTSPEGEVIGVVGMIHEITQRKENETQREKLLAAERKRTRELASLTFAATTISSNLDIKKMMQVVAKELVQLMNIDSCAISTWDPEANTVTLLVEHIPGDSIASSKLFDPVDVDQWPSRKKVLLEGVPVQLNISEPDISKICKKNFQDAKVKSLLMIPLISQNETIGLVELEDFEKIRTYSDHEIGLAQMLCNQAAVALENARLFDAASHQLKELRVLHSIASYSAEAATVDDFIEYITNLVSKNFYSNNFGVLLLDQSESVLKQHPSYIETKTRENITIPLDKGITGKVAHSGKTVIIPDVSQSPDYLTMDIKSLSEICVPMKINDQVIGVINAESHQLNAFGESDERFLNTLAGQVALSIERFHTKIVEERHTRQLDILNAIGQEMTGVLDQRELCDLITERLCTSFGYINCGILLISLDRQELVLESIAGAYQGLTIPGEYHHSIKAGLIGKAAREGKHVLAIDVQKNPDFIALDDYPILSELVLPLITENEVTGVLVIGSDKKDAFEDSDVSALTTLADQLAVSLEKTRLFETEKLQREQAETLREIAAILTTAINKEVILDLIFEQLGKVIPYDSAAVMLIKDSELKIEAVAGKLNALLVGDFKIPIEDNKIVHPLMEGREPVIFADVRQNPDWITIPGADEIKSWIGAPLITRGECIGILTVDGYEVGQFSAHDVQLVSAIANQAANALENSRLFYETTEALEREQTLNEITRTINIAYDLRSSMERIGQLAAGLVGADAAGISLEDPENIGTYDTFFYNAPENTPEKISSRDTGVMWEVMESRQSVLTNNYSEYPKALPFWVAAGVHGSIIVPFVSGDVVIGVLGVLSKDPDKQFTQRDLEQIESVGRQAGIAIHNAILFEETKRRSNELLALYDIALATTGVLDTPTLLKELQTKVDRLLEPDGYGVYLYDQENNKFEAVMALGGDEQVEETIGVRYTMEPEGFIGWVMENHEPLLVRDVNSNDLPVAPKNLFHSVQSWLGVPLISREKLVGAIAVQSFKANAFDYEDRRFLESLAGQVAIALENARLYEELEDAFVQTVLTLANAIEMRDSYTIDHGERMASWVEETGRLMGVSEGDLETLRWAALLHDIGKIGVPDEILLKPATLTEKEYEVIQRHPAHGASIVEPVKKLKDVAPIIRHHQEKYDGTGYPDGLAGEDIPLGARILMVVDSYVAITDDRIYRKARSHKVAVKEIKSLSGKQYDPKVVKVFLKFIKDVQKSEGNGSTSSKGST